MTAARSLVLRAATRDDVATVLMFIRELADYEKLGHEVVATEELLEQWLFGDRPVAEVVLAEDDGSPVGFALYFWSFSTFLGRPGIWLEDLYVRPAARGHGIGRSLLARLAQIAVAAGGGRVEWAVLDWNEPAIGFYRRLGAVGMNDWTTFRLAGSALDRLAQE